MNELVGGPAGLPLNVRLQFSKLICTNYVLVSALFSYRPAHRRRAKMPHRVTYFGKRRRGPEAIIERIVVAKLRERLRPDSKQSVRQGTFYDKSNCSREDSNLHGLPHTVLSRTRLPVPPREQKSGSYNARVAACLQAESSDSRE